MFETILLSLLIATVAWAIGKGRKRPGSVVQCPHCQQWIKRGTDLCPACHRGLPVEPRPARPNPYQQPSRRR